jgi:hypothetical protein
MIMETPAGIVYCPVKYSDHRLGALIIHASPHPLDLEEK